MSEFTIDYCPSCGERLIKNDGVMPEKCQNCFIDVRRYYVKPEKSSTPKTKEDAAGFMPLMLSVLMTLRFEGGITQNTFELLRSVITELTTFIETLPDDIPQANNT